MASDGTSVYDEDSVPGPALRPRSSAPHGTARWHAACTDNPGRMALMFNVMITALELVAGLVLAGGLVIVVAVLAALELGRLATRDYEQREVAPVAGDGPRCRAAA
jgi:hypothetical protein